jgi:LysR family transcriptional activator of nhaA
MVTLNYHHLRYFWVIAHEQSLTRAAKRLHVSQSALSIQLRKLEERVGHALFDRRNRSLALTEAGKLALDYADTIFAAGDELLGTLQDRPTARRQVLRVGAVATLSRNFQMSLLRPLLGHPGLELVLRSASLRDLLGQLRAHALDVVLSTQVVKRDAETPWHSHLLDEQPVSLVSRPTRRRRGFRFPEDLRDQPLLLPSMDSELRHSFDLLLEAAGIRPQIAAEVDDMAMLRLLAREHHGLTLVPGIVVKDELRSGALVERHRIAGLREPFYAVTLARRFPNDLIKKLLAKRPGARSSIRG